jgi:NAD(P)-dependent dehydrogenase (short-subunit alcohol dehydrogenase family)
MTVVVITGASAGVGRATARAFAGRGYDVALIARDVDRLAAAETEVSSRGRRALALSLDVADPDAVEAAATGVEAELGPIDVWVNAAMTSALAPVDQLPSEEVRRVTDVTYLGTVYGTQAALRRMRPRDRGVIVQVSSGLAYRSVPLQAAYCGAKAAARGFTDALRCELLHDRSQVRVTMVNLPAVNTPQFSWVRSRMPRAMQPLPPVYQPEVAARAIVWVAEHERRELSVGWPTVLALLGQRIAPGLMDRYLADRAWVGQMSDDPARPGSPDNLDAPVAASVGAHGAFDEMASDRSPLLWADTHRGLVTGALTGAVIGAAAIAVGAARSLRKS